MDEEKEEKQDGFTDAIVRVLARVSSDKVRLMYICVALLLLVVLLRLSPDYPVLAIFLSVVLVVVAVFIDLVVRKRRKTT